MKCIDISEGELQEYESLVKDFESQRTNVLVDAVSYLYLYTQEEYFLDENYKRVFWLYSELRKLLILKFIESEMLRKIKDLMLVRRKQLDWLEQELRLAVIEIEKYQDEDPERKVLINRYVRFFNKEIADWKMGNDDFYV